MKKRTILGLSSLLLLAAAAALFALSAQPASAQQAEALVSNLGQTEEEGGGDLNLDAHAQGFTTGGNSRGYTLYSVDVALYIRDSRAEDKITAAILSDSGGQPGHFVSQLIVPNISSNAFGQTQTVRFAAPPGSGVQLEPNTTYHFAIDSLAGQTISGTGGNAPRIRNTLSDGEDPGAASGWSIANHGHSRASSSTDPWTALNPTASRQIRVNGVANIPVECTTPNADGAYLVPQYWALNPSGDPEVDILAGVRPGDKFRLLFITSTGEEPTATGIAHYNTFVQTRAKAGHAAISDSCGNLFKIVGSTSAVDARDNTGTTGDGVPIYWLTGNKLADHYADFYDGDWDDHEHRDESGNSAGSTEIYTGSNQDGTRHGTNPLGATRVIVGITEPGNNPLSAYDLATSGASSPYYALSPVFVVGPPGLTISIDGGHTDIDEGGFRTLVFTLGNPAPPGGTDIGDLGSPSGADITATSRVIPEGQTSIEFLIRAHDNADYTPSRTVTYTFPNHNNLPGGDSLTITLSVNDDDEGAPVPSGQIPRSAKIYYWGDLDDDDPGGYGAGAVIHLPVPRFIQNNDRYQRATLLRIQGHKAEDDDKKSFGAAMCGRRGSTYGLTKYATFINSGPTVIGDHVIDDDQRWPLYRMHISNGVVKLPVHLCPGSKGETIIVTWTDVNNYTSSNQPGYDRNVPQTENVVPWNYGASHCRRDSDPDPWGHQCQTVVTIGNPDGTVTGGTHRLSQVNIVGSSDGPEGQDAEFVLTADPAPEAPLQVKVEVTATGDFGVTPGTRTVTIPTRGYATFRIATTDDDVDEPDGTVTITLKADRRYTIGPDSAATGLIRDDDLTLGGLKQGQGSPPSKPEVSVTGVIGGEEGEDVIFFVEADRPPSIPTAVLLKVTATGDYRVKTGTRIISLPAGSGHANLRIPTRDDRVDEPDGTVTVALQAGHAYTVGAISSQTGHILDNDITPPKVSVADAIAQEGDDLEFVISLSYPANGPVTVYYNTVDWYAWSPEDYASVLGWLTIPAGDTDATVRVATVVDDLDEENEKMLLDISGIEGGGAVLEDGRADGIISDDPVDTTPKPELSISGGAGITEGGTATFTITASFAPEDPITVRVGVTQNGDFGAADTATVTVSGATTAFTIATTDDNADEPDGSVTATLQGGSDYTVSSSNGAATVSVADDDLPPPVASITGGSGITEGGTASFTITVNPAPASPITVQVGVSQNGDFGASGAATVSVSGASATYTVTTSDDSTDEPDGSVTATLQSGQGYTVSSSNGAATVTVADDDLPPPTPEVNVTGSSGGEEGQDVTFTLTANPAPAATLGVVITVTASGDYGVYTGTWVEGIPTDGSVVVTLTTTDDSADEPDGSVTLTLNGGQGYTVGSLSSDTATVTDNDEPQQQQPQQQPPPTPEVSITAGSGITEGGAAKFTITANPAPASPITVKVGVSQTGDFGASGAATVTVSGASTTYTVTTADDSTDEADGSVTATLQSGSGYTVGSASSATVAVSDDDVPEVSITAGSGITEGGAASFTITASPVPSSPITVKVGVSETGDFGASGAATVSVSGATTTYTVTTTDDSTDEADGSVTATLQAGSGYTVSSTQGAATVAVEDDDMEAPAVTVSVEDGSAREGGMIWFRVTLSQASDEEVRVDWNTQSIEGVEGRAKRDLDYQANEGTIVIKAGETAGTGLLFLEKDDKVEGDEYFEVALSGAEGATIADGVATMTIIDDD